MAKKWLKAHPHCHCWDDPFAKAIAKMMETLAQEILQAHHPNLKGGETNQ